jgi:hypothetical protein
MRCASSLIRRRFLALRTTGMRPAATTAAGMGSTKRATNWQRVLGGASSCGDGGGGDAAAAAVQVLEETQIARLVRGAGRIAAVRDTTNQPAAVAARHVSWLLVNGLHPSPLCRLCRAPSSTPSSLHLMARPNNCRQPRAPQWAGYGSVKALTVAQPRPGGGGGQVTRQLVAKAVDPPRGRAGDAGHRRKLDSYAVEVSVDAYECVLVLCCDVWRGVCVSIGRGGDFGCHCSGSIQ